MAEHHCRVWRKLVRFLLSMSSRPGLVLGGCPCFTKDELTRQTLQPNNRKSLSFSASDDNPSQVKTTTLEYASGWTFASTLSQVNGPEQTVPTETASLASCSTNHQGSETTIANLTLQNYMDCNALRQTYGQDRAAGVSVDQRLPQGDDVLTFSTPLGFEEFGEADIHMVINSDHKDRIMSDFDGTLIVNDKSKGSTWLLHLPSQSAVVVDLPFAGGNHETAVSPAAMDGGATIAVPHYETAEGNGLTEGGGTPGSQVSLIDALLVCFTVPPIHTRHLQNHMVQCSSTTATSS